MTESERVQRLGERMGYGRVMQLAESLWRAKLVREQGFSGGELTVGPSAAALTPCDCVTQNQADCDWCCGTGRVTDRVLIAMRDE